MVKRKVGGLERISPQRQIAPRFVFRRGTGSGAEPPWRYFKQFKQLRTTGFTAVTPR